MQNRVTIRGESPRIAEEARSQQLLNRQQLNNRILRDRIKKEASRRYDVAVRKGLDAGIKEGGQLEFIGRRAKKIRVARRASERGFLLLPSSGFDAEGKIFVRSAYGINPYAYALSKLGLPEPQGDLLPFEFVNNRLEPATHPAIKVVSYVNPIPTGNIAAGNMEYPDPQSAQEIFNRATIECLVYLEAGEEMPPTFEDFGSTSRTTLYYAQATLSIGAYDILPLTKTETMLLAGSSTFGPGIKSNWSTTAQLPDGGRGQLDLMVGTGTYHFAATFANGQVRRFFNGNLIEVSDIPLSFGSLGSLGFRLSSFIYKRMFLSTTGPLEYLIADECSLIPLRVGISSIRFTPGVELYSGTSFTPPVSITDLA
jgi:hypothetical protein